jgi:hypothetical protein
VTKAPPSRRPSPFTVPPLLILAAALSSCGGDGGGDVQPNPVTAVTVTAPTTEISVGQTVQLTATARDANGTVLEGKSFEWTSGIGTVASVSPSGLVTGLVKGQSEIRATTEGVSGSIVITVAVAQPPDPVTLDLQEIASGLEFLERVNQLHHPLPWTLDGRGCSVAA